MNENLFTFSLSVFTGFFAIMNPIANTPIFLGLAGDQSDAVKKQIAKKATLIAFIIVTVFVVLGKYIFELFGITIPAFKITGGILIFYVGFEMLMSKKSSIHGHKMNEDTEGIAISPLAIPILAGPGTIVTAMNHVTNAGYLKVGIVVVIFALMVYLTYLAFSLSEYILKKIGNNLITVIGKIMGLILAIMGNGMVIEGIRMAFNR
ncbi:MarC family protein [Maribellus mangrovi]|uniref:MarC family protein n=1 Tax=Maribellus mangrovi TaxID=3133146 RepID=UPI0030EDD01E